MRVKNLQAVILSSSVLVVCFGLLSPLAYAAIYKIDVNGVIDPIVAEYIIHSIRQAELENADFLLIQLQTPGGLGLSMEEVTSSILNSKVPVVIYVAPSGAKAASAGFFILLSADVAAMAPGTNTGAAHPILSIGGYPVVSEATKPIVEKITNDAAASLRSIAKRRGRNADLAEQGIRDSKSFTDTEALNGGLIDLIAKDQADLLEKLDGRRIVMFNGREVILRTKQNSVQPLEMNTRQKFLRFITNPTITILLLIGGILLLYFEFVHPGGIAPGVIGGICILLALLGMNMLPINYVGILLILLALGLFIAEVKVQSFGILGLGGIIAMVLGVVMLVDTSRSEVGGIGLKTALVIVIPFAIILMLLLRLAIRATRRKVATGTEGMVGWIGVAQTPIDREGKVFVRGELWNAFAETPIAQGKKVRVLSVDNLKVHVEEVHE